MPRHPRRTPVIWQLTALNLNAKRFVTGTLLKKEPYSRVEGVNLLQHLSGLVKTYFARPCPDLEILIHTGNSLVETTTDHHGRFQVAIDVNSGTVTKITLPDHTSELPYVQSYPVVFNNSDGKIDVISDIDDTIVKSYTSSLVKRVGTILFRKPHKRKPVNFTMDMLNEFTRRGAGMFYVSKSEGNLFRLLTGVIESTGLPRGVLFLTPYLKYSQLLDRKKGISFKTDSIRFLLENLTEKRFILFGDDTQNDMKVYAGIIGEAPHRILKVYIRRTRKRWGSLHREMFRELEETGIPVKIFNANEGADLSDEIFKAWL